MTTPKAGAGRPVPANGSRAALADSDDDSSVATGAEGEDAVEYKGEIVSLQKDEVGGRGGVACAAAAALAFCTPPVQDFVAVLYAALKKRVHVVSHDGRL